MNYRAYFWGPNLGPDYPQGSAQTKYKLDIIADTGSNEYTEIELAANEPVKLTYDTSETPFEPVRTSRLSVNVVVDSYLEDILPSAPQEVKVLLYNITFNKTEWVGWMTPMVLSAGYRDEFETFELQANDCLLNLQYFPYQPLDGNDVEFVSFRDILGHICDTSGLLSGFRWALTKSVKGDNLYPEQLYVNEKNFYFSDVDETLKLDEVLSEICRYIGVTAVQMGDMLLLIDYQSLGKSSTHRMTNYLKSNLYGRGSTNYHGGTVTLSQDYVAGPQPSITIEPIKNKIEVHDNFYSADYFIPDPFDDDMLTNRICADTFYYTTEVSYTLPPVPQYPDGTRWIFGQKMSNDCIEDKKEPSNNADDSSYRYFYRVYDHEMYESVYGGVPGPIPVWYAATGATIVDFAAVKNDFVNEYGQMIVANKRDFTRYLMIKQANAGTFPFDFEVKYGVLLPKNAPPQQTPVFRLKSGYRADVILGSGSYIVIGGSAMFTRYEDRPYINPIWTSDGNKIKWNSTKNRIASAGNLAFNLGIGGKWWNGESWQSTKVGFWVPLTLSQDEYPFWMIDAQILNNVRWDANINADGYKIPLSGVDTSQEITFEVLLPSLQWYYDNQASYNGYCWIKGLSIKAYKEGQDAETVDEEKDYVTTNIINSGSVQEMQTIELKITTSNDTSHPAWSDCVYQTGSTKELLSTVLETAISASAQTPEMNIVQKHVDQYSSMTKKISMDVPLSITQLNRIQGADVDSPSDSYVILGSEISYADGKQRIEMIKKN